MSKFTDYTIKDEVTRRIADHEILLGFNCDWQAEAFQDWLESKGMAVFSEWLEENKENYSS